MDVQLTSRLICPDCGGVAEEEMLTNACQYFYECPHCAVILKPKPGECCVFCSYGDVKCPPVQQERGCG
jgi:hypothetical protein